MTETPNWQYPANPDDGDFVIRGNIKATYDASTQTWDVGEIPQYPGIEGPIGPPGPEGPKGDPGTGVNVTAIVDTLLDLPAPPQKEDEFVIVDDTNTLFYSDGIEWYDLGSPIQGPQGEKGDDGADGINGINGRNGKGWTGTTIIDEREENPPNYQIRFDSDDGLGFVTDNIVGAQGIPGELEVASETNLGGIKIGRGLNILPDGTAQAGETYVDLETVPLGSDGTPDVVDEIDKFTLQYMPFFESWNDTLVGVQDGSMNSSRPWQVSKEFTWTFPEEATSAIIYYFSSSGVSNYAAPGSLVPAWFQGETKIEVTGEAEFVDGGRLNVPHSFAWSVRSNQSGGDQASPSLKIGLIRFPKGGATVTFKASAKVDTARKASYKLGRGRLVAVPYKTGKGDDAAAGGETKMRQFVEEFSDIFDPSSDFEGFPPITDEENMLSDAAEFKTQISQLKQYIDELTVEEFPSGTTGYTTLMGYRNELIALRDLPGDADVIGAEIERLDDAIHTIGDYSFRFEPMP